MIHVATVHWGTSRWIEPQLRQLDRHLEEPYRIYAFLDEAPSKLASRFSYVSTERIVDHATKLNLLADVIRFNGHSSDRLIFMDGDALLVAAIAPMLRSRLQRHGLVAVQRRENNGDVQPHPCFCVTTIGLWHEVGGDWHPGHSWRDPQGRAVTDVGGNLLAVLDAAAIDWYPLRRVNNVNLHPVFFGVYGDATYGGIVYHHGAASRKGALTRGDFETDEFQALRSKRLSRTLRRLPKRGPLVGLKARYDPVQRWKVNRVEQAKQTGERLFAEINRDEDFWRELV